MIHFLDFKNNFQFFSYLTKTNVPSQKVGHHLPPRQFLYFVSFFFFLSISCHLSVFLSSHISVIAPFLLSLKRVVASWQRRIGFHFYFCLFVDLFVDMFLLVVFETHLSWPSFMNIWRRLHSYFLKFLVKEKHISS